MKPALYSAVDMFESLTEAAAPDDDRWRLLRRVFFVVPPAFSALCLAVFTAARISAWSPVSDAVALIWMIGVIVIPMALAVLVARTGRWRWAAGALGYGYALAVAVGGVAIFISIATVQ